MVKVHEEYKHLATREVMGSTHTIVPKKQRNLRGGTEGGRSVCRLSELILEQRYINDSPFEGTESSSSSLQG